MHQLSVQAELCTKSKRLLKCIIHIQFSIHVQVVLGIVALYSICVGLVSPYFVILSLDTSSILIRQPVEKLYTQDHDKQAQRHNYK